MEFRLLYSGRVLGASRNNTRPDAKHGLRREFHPQLRQLWASNKNLDEFARHHCAPWFNKHPDQRTVASNTFTNEQFRKIGIECIAKNWQLGKYRFVPLVTGDLPLRCHVDILFLRPEDSRSVMNSGDLDARVKTIFDALRVPNDLSETGGMEPQEDETPFFCLLSDDKLISGVSVTCDELLVLPKERSVNPSDAFLAIHVKIRPTQRTPNAPLAYLFD